MLEPIKVIVGEKVIEVEPGAFWKYLIYGEDATERRIDRAEFAGDDKLARIYKDWLADMKPLIKALDDYIIEPAK